MDLRTQTSLACGALALAISVSVLLRKHPRRARVFMALFAGDVGLWYLASWLYHRGQAELWVHFTAVLAVLAPQFALHLFEAIVPGPGRRKLLLRVAGFLAIPMLAVALLPQHDHPLVRGAVIVYVFGLLGVGLWTLALRGKRSRSRAVQRRVWLLVLVGGLATVFSLADFLWFVGAPLPPVGAVLNVVFLFALAESLTRERLVDLYELIGRLLVATALAFCLAGIFYVFVVLLGAFQTTYLSAVLAAIVILVLIEPLQAKVEQFIHAAVFRERADLEKAVELARTRLLNVLEVGEMTAVVMSALENSHRTSGAALYLRDPLGTDFELSAWFGPRAPSRVDGVTARPLLDRLKDQQSIALEQLAQRASARRQQPEGGKGAADEHLLAAAELLGPFRAGVCLGVYTHEGELIGIVVVVDDRVSDAFAYDDIGLLEQLAIRIGVVIENSQRYQRMHERDRLAALGQMAAGLAHEVKNPLGAIKGAAQLLADPGARMVGEPGHEFLGIIVEEVERLDRVVTSILDYGRPSPGNPGPVDANSVVKRTLQVLETDPDDRCNVHAEFTPDLPLVQVDPEQLRQVVINLVRNAMQAGSDDVVVETRLRALSAEKDGVEIAVRDDGPGIAPSALKSLFIPFVTTKERGTGLGLAISQRVVERAGGRIEVSSQLGQGATFSVVLPTADDPVPGLPASARIATPAPPR